MQVLKKPLTLRKASSVMQYVAYNVKFETQNRNPCVILNTVSYDFSYQKGKSHYEYQKSGKVHLFRKYNIQHCYSQSSLNNLITYLYIRKMCKNS